MKKRMVIAMLVAGAAALAAACGETPQTAGDKRSSRNPPVVRQTPPVTQSHERVPAYQDAKSASDLPPTLAPEQFVGLTRDAYRVAREIPETIAQLPCYCHCDMSFGHKSLHSCFVDNHASQCAVCVNEALIAYDMQKKGMSPAQIRERIIAQYSSEQ